MPILRVCVCLLALVLCLEAAPSGAASPSAAPAPARPVLAFYYMWYSHSTWCSCTMSDLPRTLYDSSDPATMDRQIKQAWTHGITGFITSWPGPGSTQDVNLKVLLNRIKHFDATTGAHFVTSIYLETDLIHNLRSALAYAIAQYAHSPVFFRWNGRPVIFIWAPLGNGRSLATWTNLRRDVDPHDRTFWSAEGTDLRLLSVFDGIHLFSAAYWGLLDGSIGAVDARFRAGVNQYNAAHDTARVWAAGVEPGYDDTRIPGRAGTYRVPRQNGATYRLSWSAGIASRPDWITISTWNEWFEGAMIEPSRTYRSLYLRLTRQYAAAWRSRR